MRFSQLDGRRVAVWGAGVETRSFAGVLHSKLPSASITTLIVDDGTATPEFAGARLVAPADAVGSTDYDVLVRSPGVSIHRPEIRAITDRGVPVATPTGLWFAERQGRRTLGVTATKGKSTTAALVAHLVAATGRRVQLAGNIGRPALELLDHDEDLAIVELSSYQIADLTHGPEVAMANNLFREHLHWHLTEEAYRADKLRLLNLPGVRRCVVNELSAEVMSAPRAPGPVYRYGRAPHWHVTTAGAVAGPGTDTIPRADLPLRGAHNALNVCAALTALEALEVPVPVLPAAFGGFSGLAHRLQTVHAADGIEWIDDSISTTPESAIAALEAFPDQPVILIAGGFDRGQDYRALGVAVARRGATVIALPTTGNRIVAAVRAAGGTAILAENLASAVTEARARAARGTIALLSPAAPSFNTHKDFKARGDDFRDLARALPN